VAEYITSVFRTFGLCGTSDIGFPVGEEGEGATAGGGMKKEDVLAPVLDALTAFREKVRVASKSGNGNDIMRVCDSLRDDTLPLLGVRLEDVDGVSESRGGGGDG